MTNPFRIIALSWCAFVLGGCSSLEIDYDFDPGIQISGYATFSAKPVVLPEWNDDTVKILGTNGIALDFAIQELEDRGYRYIREGEVDFLIAVRSAAVYTEEEVPAVVAGVDSSDLSRSRDPFPPTTQTDPLHRREINRRERLDQTNSAVVVGRTEYYLIIEIIDQPTKRLAWQGWARQSSIKSFKDDPYKQELVSQILARFPN